MIHFLISVILFLMVQINCDSALNISLGENIVIYTDDSPATNWLFISKSQEKIIDKCQVYHSGPRGKKNYTISLEKNKTTELYRSDNISCSFKIPQVRHEHFGEWIVITSFGDKNISGKVTIYEKKIVKPLPSEILFVNQGDNVKIKINQSDIFGDNYNKKNSSGLLDLNSENIEFHLEKIGSKIEIDVNNSGNEDFMKSGQSEIKIHVTPEKIGTWSLTGKYNYTKISAYFKIIMVTTLYWEKKSSQTLKLDVDGENGVDSCEIIKPKNQLITLNSKSCEYQIDNVTIDHAGTWIGRYLPKNLVALRAEQRFKVIVFENQKKTDAKLGDTLKIECRFPDKFSNCSIQSPNGSPLPGAVNDKNICSIIEANATSIHSGQWFCNFLLPDGRQIQSIIPVIIKEPLQSSNFLFIFGLIFLSVVIILSIIFFFYSRRN